MQKWTLLSLLIITVIGVMLQPQGVSNAQPPDCTITGVAYRDPNQDGIFGAPIEIGMPGITVTVYDAAGNFAQTTTAADGSYTFDGTVPGFAALGGAELRVEFTGLPDFLSPGPSSNNVNGGVGGDDSTVIFVDCTGGATVNASTGLANPANYCDAQPLLVISCFVRGDQNVGPDATTDVLISFPYDAGRAMPPFPANGAEAIDPADSPDVPGPTDEAVANQLGTVYGIAYQRQTDTLFSAPLIRRHTGILDTDDDEIGNTGVIFQIENISDPVPFSSPVSVFVDLDTLPGAPAPVAGADPRPAYSTQAPDFYIFDFDAYTAPGKLGWGDLDMSSDDRTLYAVNLFDRSVYVIPIGIPATPPTDFSQITRVPVPTPGNCPTATDVRPFALKYEVDTNTLYVGAVCSAESTQDLANLFGYIFEFNTTSNTFNPTPVLQFPLSYPRGCHSGGPAPCAGYPTDAVAYLSTGDADWYPWLPDGAPFPYGGMATGGDVSYSQPIIGDIEFDGRDMIISLIDRWGYMHADQAGVQPYDDVTPQTNNARSGGDILRACWTGATWELEDNAACGGLITAGANSGEGPGGGEYYYSDGWQRLADEPHQETVVGGLVQIPGLPNVAVSVYDPIPYTEPFSAGVRWMRNRTDIGGVGVGQYAQYYRVFQATGGSAATLFGKGNGLGDLEGLCGPAPIEIGNLVWEDLDRNGQQDPGELKIGGVIVSLYIDLNNDGFAESLVATDTTEANGEYYFNEANIFDDLALLDPSGNGPGLPDPGVHFFDVDGDGIRDPNEPGGILPTMNYRITLENAANYTVGGPLANYYATVPDAVVIVDNAEIRDSDGLVTTDGVTPGDFNQLVSETNYSQTELTTGQFGDNNHTYDFGFSRILTPTETPTPTPTFTATVTPTITATPTSTVTISPSPTPTGDLPTGTPVGPPSTGTPDFPTMPPITTTPGTPPVFPPPRSTPDQELPPNVIANKEVSPAFAQPGDTVTWTVTVTNPSSQAVAVLDLIDNIPLELIVISASSDIGSTVINGQQVIFSINSLAAGETATITIITRIRDDVPVPFTIVNSLGGDDATVVSVQRLPDTGQVSWWRQMLPIMGVLTVVVLMLSTGWLLQQHRTD